MTEKADYIAELIAPVMKDEDRDNVNLLLNQAVADDLKRGKSALQQVVLKCVTTDHVVPSMSATLEWVKYQTNTELPASFYEAELDYFGAHMFDRKDEDAPGPTEGKVRSRRGDFGSCRANVCVCSITTSGSRRERAETRKLLGVK